MSAIPAYQGISGFPAKNDDGTFSSFRWLGNAKIFGEMKLPVQILIYVILVILMYILLHKTKYGRSIFLVGVNTQAAEYSGINTRLVKMSTYMLTGVGAAIAGILLTSQLNSSKYDLGSTYTLSIITAVVLGGTLSTGGKGSIIGTALASLVICMLRFGLTLCFKMSSQNLDLPVGIMLLVVVSGRQLIRIVRHLDS